MRTPEAWGQPCPHPDWFQARLFHWGHVSAMATDRTPRGKRRMWRWSRCAPECRLILAAFVGPRRFASALPRMRMTAAVVLGVPCFVRAGLSCDLSALMDVYHTFKTWPHTGKPGRPTPPIKGSPPELVDGQVSKQTRQGRLHEGVYGVCGGPKRREEWGRTIRTRVLTRLPLTRRQAVAPLVRNSGSCGQDRTQRCRRVVVLQAFYNCAQPHMRLRRPLPAQAPPAAGLIQPKWCHRTPGMAAGLMDHVWTFRELLTATFAPIHHQSGSE